MLRKPKKNTDSEIAEKLLWIYQQAEETRKAAIEIKVAVAKLEKQVFKRG